METQKTYSLIDKLVLLDEEIKSLEKRKEELKAQVIALGEGAHPGHEGSVSIALQNRKTFKSDKAKVFLTEEQFQSCYETGASIVVRITRFNREEVAK